MDEKIEATLESWAIAEKIARSIGLVSSIFSQSIREIKLAEAKAYDNKEDRETLRDLTQIKARFLIRVSPSLKAVFYFAAKTIYPDKLKTCTPLTVPNILSLFKPDEIAAIIAITYLYRQIKKKCPEKEWNILEKKLYTQTEIGMIIGETINNIDTGNGMLIGAIRYLSIGLFLANDEEKYKQVKRRLKHSREIFHLKLEEEVWGCNHLQVAAVLVQLMGFGLEAGHGLSSGLDMPSQTISIKIEQVPEQDVDSESKEFRDTLVCWQEALNWIESFDSRGEQPAGISVDDDQDKMSVPSSLVSDLQEAIADIKDVDPRFDWIAKNKGDIPLEVMEQLDLSKEFLEEIDEAIADNNVHE